MTIIYVTGAAGTPMASDDLARTCKELHDASGNPEVLLSHPTTTATCAERLSAVTTADLVVLVKGWEADQLARRDAQVAVWAGKPIRVDAGLRRGTRGGTPIPVLHDYADIYERVQTILDRGLQSTIDDAAPHGIGLDGRCDECDGPGAG